MPASAGLCTLQPDMQQGLVDVLDSMWNARDVDGMLELFSDDAVVWVTPPLPLGFRSTFRGKQAVRKALERITKGTSIQSSGCQSTGPVITWRSTISSRGWGGWGPAHIEFEAQLEAGKMASVLVRRGLKEAPVAPDATQQAAPAASEPRRAAPLRTDRLRIGFFSHHRGGEQIDDSMLDARPLGGTETAVLRTSRALRDMGHEVRLYQDPEELNRLSGLDVLVIKHLPLVFDRPVAARTYLWSSDDIDDPAWQRAYEPGYRDRFVASMDGIFALSKYHAGRIASLGIPEQKILVLRYGIDPALFDDLGELDEASRPPRCVYTSTPFRGLSILLDAWPSIRACVPEATLEVFSSMKVYYASADSADSDYQELYERARSLPGVAYVGAVPQPRLAAALKGSRLLLYPNVFPETCCIAALEAQAAGCAIVSSELGALPETAQGNPLLAGDPTSQKYQAQFVETAIGLLTDDERWRRLSGQNRARMRHYTWEAVARDLIAAVTS